MIAQQDFVCISPDVRLGENVKLSKFINLYGCSIGANTHFGSMSKFIFRPNASEIFFRLYWPSCLEMTMPQPHRPDPASAPIGQRRCPKCGLPMFLSQIEPADTVGQDRRTFECTTCAYAEIVTVQFR